MRPKTPLLMYEVCSILGKGFAFLGWRLDLEYVGTVSWFALFYLFGYDQNISGLEATLLVVWDEE